MAFDNWIIFATSSFGFLIGIALFVTGLYSMHLRRLIQNIPTSKIGSVAIGLVEVCGRVELCGCRLSSPFSGRDCAYYRFTIEEQMSSDDNGWTMIKEGGEETCFYLREEAGRIKVNPQGASVQIALSYEFYKESKDPVPLRIAKFLEDNDLVNEGLMSFGRRFREYYIQPGDLLYVMGTAEIDSKRRNTRSSAGNLVILRGKNTNTFVIADSSEKDMLNRLNRRATLGIYGGAALSAMCLAYLISVLD